MSAPKPIGFDNFRSHFFQSRDGSAKGFYKKCSFSVVVSSMHELFAGPSIASTNASATVTITTVEAHGLRAGMDVRINGMPSGHSAMNAEWVVLSAPTTTTFTIGFDTSAAGTTTGFGIAGVNMHAYIPAADYARIPGRLCTEDYPSAWELPMEG